MKSRHSLFRNILATALILGAVGLTHAQSPPVMSHVETPDLAAGIKALRDQIPTEVRALWVTRWDFTKPEHVKAIIQNASDLNFNVILFQVRGNGTAFYNSKIEPWAWELTSESPATTGQDPGWDPLAIAIEEGRKKGVEIHAYINVFPAWRARDYPPKESGQLWWEHPDWFMCDASGKRMLPRDKRFTEFPDWYSFISPGVPEVQDYIASICEELAQNYDIDGIHFDYIRYPAEIKEVDEAYQERAKKLGNWSYDAVSIARFQQETGNSAPDDDPEAWTQWRSDQITAMVKQCRERVDAVKEGVCLSAAVMADPNDARARKYQDYVRWMREGYLDVAITMNYTKDSAKFIERCQILLDQRPDKGYIIPGMNFGYSTESTLDQIKLTREMPVDGFGGFAYSHIFDRDNGHARKPGADALADGPLSTTARVPWD